MRKNVTQSSAGSDRLRTGQTGNAGVVAEAHAFGRHEFECLRFGDVIRELDQRFNSRATRMVRRDWRRVWKGRPVAAALALGVISLEELIGLRRWRACIDSNLVVNTGLDDYLERLWLGSAYTAQHYLGLIDGPSPTIAAGDTMASHAGWDEFTDYTDTGGERHDLTGALGAVSSQSLTVSAPIEYTITGAGDVNGGFTTTGAAKSGTTGILISAGVFAEGNRPVVSDDVLRVSPTFTQAAAA